MLPYQLVIECFQFSMPLDNKKGLIMIKVDTWVSFTRASIIIAIIVRSKWNTSPYKVDDFRKVATRLALDDLTL